MTRDDIKRMAQEAGMREGESGDWTAADAALTYPECVYTENLERFAHLVAAAEREACAKVCEQPVDEIQITDDCSEYKYRDNQECADAIRAKGQE